MNKLDIQFWIELIRAKRNDPSSDVVMDLKTRKFFSKNDYTVPTGDVKISVYRSGGETVTDE